MTLVGLLAGISIAGEHDHEVERPPWRAAAQAITKDGEPDLVVACCGILAEPAAHYLAGFERFDDDAIGDVEFRQVVVASIRRPDRRPMDDSCWWGGPCQADDALGAGGPPANPGALSQAFSSIFGRAETSTRGPIRLERYHSATPVSLGTRSGISLHEGVVVVGDETAVKGVQVLVRGR